MIRNLAAKVCMASVCLSALPSCDRWFYEEEGDCSVYYRLKFRYDKNLKWADAFANEVSSVHLYAFDKSGVLVWQREEQIDPTTAENYSMSLDLPAGDYRLLAWCGLRNDGEREESFSVPEARVGETRMKQLQCALNRKYDESGAYSKERLYRLFHGTLDVSLPSNDDGGSYDYTMCLTKNTNHVRVILHHLSGEDVDVNQFVFRIEDENGLMAHDNELMEDENITYRPWKTQNGEAGVGKDDTRAVIQVKGAIADLTVTEIYEFLTWLHAPENIIRKAPSAGLFEGQTDEQEMGVTYAAIDKYILTGEASEHDKAIIDRYHSRSEHKRRPAATYHAE